MLLAQGCLGPNRPEGGKIMSKYEIMFIVKTTIDEAAVKQSADSLKSIITDKKGKVIDFKEMGQKEFAYPIQKMISGYYYLMICEASSEAIAEFERKAGIDENVLRHLIIKLDEE